MLHITDGLRYQYLDAQKKIHLIQYDQKMNLHLTLLLSKVSEVITPKTQGNHIGEGANMHTILQKQEGIRFIINGGFNHYRKHFYDWEHQNFNVGDPVGIVKIREHIFEDYIDIAHYGFLTQQDKSSDWKIVNHDKLDKSAKYILGCTPLLIYNGNKINLPEHLLSPVPEGKINPPSILGHGLQSHPRTAIGIKNNTLFFIVVEGINDGCTLIELQNIGVEMGLDSLLNLDGGGSSQFQLKHENRYIKNNIAEEDKDRILGHVMILFDETLKN